MELRHIWMATQTQEPEYLGSNLSSIAYKANDVVKLCILPLVSSSTIRG